MKKQEQNETRKSVKCPVCGRFTSEKSVKAYRQKAESRIHDLESIIGQASDRIKALEAQLAEAGVRNKNLGRWVEEKNMRIATQNYKLERLGDEIKRLRARNWWQRLWNVE